MVSATDCLNIFNARIRGTPISIDKLILLYSEYLTENNIENSDKLINLVVQNPQLIRTAYPKIEEYFCKKYNILKLQGQNALNINQTILFYV